MWTKCVAVEPLAGAPGIEPGNGGIKIRCLTAWLRPNRDCLLRVTPWGFKARKPEPDRRTRSERLRECSHVRVLRGIEGGGARCNARLKEGGVQRGSPPKTSRSSRSDCFICSMSWPRWPSIRWGAAHPLLCLQLSIASRCWLDAPRGALPMGSRRLVLEGGAPTRVMARGRHRGPARGWWRSGQLPGAMGAKAMGNPALFSNFAQHFAVKATHAPRRPAAISSRGCRGLAKTCRRSAFRCVQSGGYWPFFPVRGKGVATDCAPIAVEG